MYEYMAIGHSRTVQDSGVQCRTVWFHCRTVGTAVHVHCRAVGYSARQCRAAVNSVGQCRGVGYRAGQCRGVGYSAGQCRAVGYSAGQCRAVRYSVGQCREVGDRVQCRTVGTVQSMPQTKYQFCIIIAPLQMEEGT